MAACAPVAPPADAARTNIEAVNARFMELVETKDAAGIAALYTEDARILPPGSPPIDGREAIEQFFEGILEGIARVRIDTVELEVHGDTAHEQEALVFFDASGTTIDEGKAIVIWKKVAENWLLHRDIFNSNLAPAPPASEPATTPGTGEATGATGEAAPPPPPG